MTSDPEKRQTIVISLSPKQKAAIEKAAKDELLTTSAWARRVLLGAVAQHERKTYG